MKIRKGFVSNSSSTSFIVEFSGGGKFELSLPYAIDSDGNVLELLRHLHDKGIIVDMREGYYNEDEKKWVYYIEEYIDGRFPL